MNLATNSNTPPTGDYVIPAKWWACFGTQRALVILLWAITFAVTGLFLHRARSWFNNDPKVEVEKHRADGNSGHTHIDFGGQWLMGRMIVTGHGRELYHRQRQWEVLRAGYPDASESPRQRAFLEGANDTWYSVSKRRDQSQKHDAENLMGWFMGTDPEREWKIAGGAVAAQFAQPVPANPFVAIALEQAATETLTPEVITTVNTPAIGGPLYPPVHAIFYIPIGLFDNPQSGYFAFQIFSVAVLFLASLGVKFLTRGRIWWSVATLCLLLFPGTRGALDLGQNPAVSFCILVWGWALASRGYWFAGGVVWGLFAFKPVWALAFFVVPLVMRKWRFCLAMSATGIVLGAITLPIVGIDSWFHWLKVGKEASDLYKVNDNWIHLSRDLHGIPRRILHDFHKPESERETKLANALAWSLWGVVFAGTVGVYLLRGNRERVTGLSVALLFIGAYLSCYRFMYYDALLAGMAFAVLLCDWQRVCRPRVFALEATPGEPRLPDTRDLSPPPAPSNLFGARMRGYVNSFPLTILLLLFVVENSLSGLNIDFSLGIGYYATPATDGSTNHATPRVRGDTSLRHPLDTFLVLALWAWCAWRVWRGDDRDAGDAPITSR